MPYILAFDDDENQLATFESAFAALNLQAQLKKYSKIDDFKSAIEDENILINTQGIIYDLAKDSEESTKNSFAITDIIIKNYNVLRIPLFIHSAHLSHFDKLNENGTVYKFEKSKESVGKLCNLIKLFEESGFMEVFSPRGIIEKEIMIDLHKSFTVQFKNNEITEIIQRIQKIEGDNFKERIIEIFRRIALRSLMSDLMINKRISDSSFNEATISAVEHYIRRINHSNIPVWTGDIFEATDRSHKILVMTPRCDLASKNGSSFLVCCVEEFSEYTSKNVESFMRDNIKEKKFRHLPKTPIFEGGKVDLSRQILIQEEDMKNYNYVISLSDELTNEILGKFCAYFLRTSLPEVDNEELKNFLS